MNSRFISSPYLVSQVKVSIRRQFNRFCLIPVLQRCNLKVTRYKLARFFKGTQFDAWEAGEVAATVKNAKIDQTSALSAKNVSIIEDRWVEMFKWSGAAPMIRECDQFDFILNW